MPDESSTLEVHRQTILTELLSDDAEVRADYLNLFDAEAKRFAELLAAAIVAWEPVPARVAAIEQGFITGLVQAAITLHVNSMKLFLSGHIIASGNLFRQVLEAMSLALLCSGKELGVLEQFMQGQYSGAKAVAHVIREHKRLRLNAGALDALKQTQKIYNYSSHITHFTLANQMSVSGEKTYVGACFDEGKVDAYRKEIKARLGLAGVFRSFIEGVKTNVAAW
jgi:hypothetical protein